MTWTVRVIAAAIAIGTFLPLIRKDAWWIRGCEFPRVQMLVSAVAVLAVAPFAEESAGGRLLLFITVGASALLQAFRILPFTPLWHRKESPRAVPEAGETLGILVSNILMTNREVEPFIDTVRRVEPDLLLVIEADDWWQKALEPLRATYPHAIEHPQEDTYGMLLYSKLELEAGEVRFLVEDRVPSVKCVVVLSNSRRITFYGLHPRPPVPQEATETTERDAELLLVAREVRRSSEATVVAGDLNDVAWSYTTRLFRRISGLLDPRVGRGLLPTFPANRPWLRFPLDHLFHSADLSLVDLQRVSATGSDHLSIYAHLRYVEGDGPNPDAPTADREDLDLARRKIDRGLVANRIAKLRPRLESSQAATRITMATIK